MQKNTVSNRFKNGGVQRYLECIELIDRTDGKQVWTVIDYNNQMFQENRTKKYQTTQKHKQRIEIVSGMEYPQAKMQKLQSNLIKPRILGRSPYTQKNHNYKLILVAVPTELLLDCLDIYQWRVNTQYPIILARWNGVIVNKSIPIIRNRVQLKKTISTAEDIVYVEVTVQSCCLLVDSTPLPFPSLVYALKQALIGFERLYALFGQFRIKPENIAVDSKGRIKVWISSSFQQNTKCELTQANKPGIQHRQSYMIQEFKSLFQGLAHNTFISREFFKAIDSASNFIDTIKAVEAFIASRKIFVAKTIHQQIQRPFSPSLTPQQLFKVQEKIQLRQFFSPRNTTGIIKSDSGCFSKGPMYVRSKINFRNTICEIKTKQTLEEDDYLCQKQQGRLSKDFIKKDVVWKGNETEDFTPSSIEDQSEPSIKIKKADSLQRRLEELFVQENLLQDAQGKEDYIAGDKSSLKDLGRRIDSSTYIQHFLYEQN